MKTASIKIIHDFCADPDGVRQSFLDAGIGAWKPNKGEVGSSIYEGMAFWGKHAVMVHALAQAQGQPVFPNNMFVRVSNKDTERAYVHSDRESGSHTCVAYLSKHEGLSGTGFYRHRESGMTRMPSFDELRQNPEFFEQLKRQMVEGNETDWELLDFVRAEYNKAVIFDAPLFHARHPKHGFGETAEEGRMIWGCHHHLLTPTGGMTVCT